MAIDKIFLVCRGCRAVRALYRYFGGADPREDISGAELGAFIADHLFHHAEAGGFSNGYSLSEPAPFEVLTEHVLMRQEAEEQELRRRWFREYGDEDDDGQPARRRAEDG